MINWWLEKGLAGFKLMQLLTSKRFRHLILNHNGADGLAGCWRMVENVEGVGEYLEDLKEKYF